QLSNLFGPLDENLRQIADGWNVAIHRRGNRLEINGGQAKAAQRALELFHGRALHQALTVDDIQLGMVEMGAGRLPEGEATADGLPELPDVDDESLKLRVRRSDLRPRT